MFRVVLAPELEWIDRELACERVHRTLKAERAFDVPRRAKRRHRARVRVHERLRRSHVGTLVQLVVDLARAREPPANAHGDLRVHGDRRQRSVAGRRERHALRRAGTIAAIDLFTFAMVDAANVDYRDVLYWAEYPEESTTGTPEQKREAASRMAAQWRQMGLQIPEGE